MSGIKEITPRGWHLRGIRIARYPLHALALPTLAFFALLSIAAGPLEAQDEPRGYWTTTELVHVRCPDGQSAGVIDPGIGVWVVGTGNAGWLKVEGFSLKDDPCAEHYIAAEYLRPVELAFWKLDERVEGGIDVEDTHYPGGSAFQVLTTNKGTGDFTIIGPSGTPASFVSNTGLENEQFFTLRGDYCATSESAGRLIAEYTRLFAFLTTPLGAVLGCLLLIGLYWLNSWSRSRFVWPWLLGIPVSAALFCFLAASYLGYEEGWRKCEATRAFLKNQVAPNGFVLPIADARQIQSELVESAGQLAHLNQDEYRGNLERQGYLFSITLLVHCALFVRGGIVSYLSHQHDLKRSTPGKTRKRALPMARENQLMVPNNVTEGETIALRLESPMRMPSKVKPKPFVWQNDYDTKWINSNTRKVRAATELAVSQTDFIAALDGVENASATLATNRAWQEAERKEAENAATLEWERGQTALLEEEVKQTGLRADLAEAQQRLARAENPLPPEDDAAKHQREADRKFDERFGKEEAIRAAAQRRTAKALERAGGKITRDVELLINNIQDFAQRQIEEL